MRGRGEREKSGGKWISKSWVGEKVRSLIRTINATAEKNNKWKEKNGKRIRACYERT